MRRENVLYKPRVEKAPVFTPQQESANTPMYVPDNFPQSGPVETIVADDVTLPRLSREDFTEEAIIARKLTGDPRFLPSEMETIIADEAFTRPVVFEEESRPRLKPQDFTQEAIEKARARVNQAFDVQKESEVVSKVPLQETGRARTSSGYPEHWKIEHRLRVTKPGEEEGGEITYPPLSPEDQAPLRTKRLSRSDFPDAGSAEMPKLVFKKPENVVPEKKGFLKQLFSKLRFW